MGTCELDVGSQGVPFLVLQFETLPKWRLNSKSMVRVPQLNRLVVLFGSELHAARLRVRGLAIGLLALTGLEWIGCANDEMTVITFSCSVRT